MRQLLKFLAIAMLFCQSLVFVGFAAEDSAQREIGDALLPFSDMTHYIWTNKLWYQTGESITLYWTADPQGDPIPYTIFVYYQNITTGERMYLPNMTSDITDAFGNSSGNFMV